VVESTDKTMMSEILKIQDPVVTSTVVNLSGILYYSGIECGPMPNVMSALPNIGGALLSALQSFADAHYYNAMQ